MKRRARKRRVTGRIRAVIRRLGEAYVRYEYAKEKAYIWEMYGD